MSSNKKESTSEPKVGVYICHCGGNISDHVDVEQVAENIRKIPGVVVSHTNTFMCSDPGQELIQEDIKSGKINRVVVASCAPSLHELTFRGAIKRADMNPYLYDHANIREQDSWVHHGEPATAKATTLVAAAVAKTKRLEPLDPIRVDARNHVTVIGGGMAGLRAALDLSSRGIAVSVIEKSPFLGGQAANLDKLVPTEASAIDLIEQLAQAAVDDPNIQISTCSQIVGFEGYVGNFKVTVQTHPPDADTTRQIVKGITSDKSPVGQMIPFAGYFPAAIPTSEETRSIDTGVIVFATGFKTYTPRQGEFGYGDHPEVITLPMFIRHMAQPPSNGKYLSFNGKKIRRVAMIHCVGSRQIPGIHEPDENDYLNEYCSRTCCSATLRAATDIRKKFPKTQVLDFYRDIRTYGRGQEDYYDRASESNVLFFRYEPEDSPVVEKSGSSDYPLKISVKDTLTFGEEIEADVDLIILSVGMEPSPINDLVDMMKLPVGSDRFLQEVHPKLRPVELANTGILLAGTCQAPMDISEACNAAQAAAAKASALLGKGYVELDPFVAGVDLTACRGTGACVDVCPVDAVKLKPVKINGKEVERAEVNPAICTGCGVCVAECPHNAIDVKGWTLKQYEDMVDAIVAA